MFTLKNVLSCFCIFFFTLNAQAAEILDCNYSIVYRNGLPDETGAFKHQVSECLEGFPCPLEPTEITTVNSCLRFFSQTFQGYDDLITTFNVCSDSDYHKAKTKKSAQTLSVGAESGPRMVWIDCRF